ncbi:hypothetical protein D9M72_552600 [compost metagenome]
MHHFQHDDRGHVGKNGSATGCEHVEAVDLAAFTRAPPVGDQPAARCPAQCLEVAIDAPGQNQRGKVTGEARHPVSAARQYRAQGHDASATEFVGEVAVDGLANRVGPEHGGRYPAKVLFGKAELGLDTGNGETERLSPGIEKQIAKHGRQQHAPLGDAKRCAVYGETWHGLGTIHDLFLILVRSLRVAAQGALFFRCGRKSSRLVTPLAV